MVDSTGDVWTHQRQVLQCSYDAAVERRVWRRLTIIDTQLLLGVDWYGCRLAVRYAGAIKDVLRVLGLCEEEAFVIMSNLYTEKELEGTKVFDGELVT